MNAIVATKMASDPKIPMKTQKITPDGVMNSSIVHLE
jgi:hypothetical protein